MRRLQIGPAAPDQEGLNAEVARLRDLGVVAVRVAWQGVFQRDPPPHLPRHLLFRTLAYRLQADHFGDLDNESRRLLDDTRSAKAAGQRAVERGQTIGSISPGTMLTRVWNGQMHRVSVLVDGFAWNGHTYPSLSKIAFAITGTRWNGPRFFGLRDKKANEASP